MKEAPASQTAGGTTVKLAATSAETEKDFRAMATRPFPSDTSCRKVILVLHAHDIERCAYEPGAAQTLLDEQTYVLEFPVRVLEDVPAALQNLLDAGLARPGKILVQSPYDPDTYEDASLAARRFALAKHMYFSTLCMYLGAKEVNVEQIDLRTHRGQISLDLKGGRLGVSAQLTAETEELEKFRAQMHLRDEFAGAPPDLVAAEQLLRRTGLGADPGMRTLLEMRRDGSNRLITRKLILSLSSEARTNLDVVGRLRVPGYVKLSAEYEKIVREQYDYTLTVLVRFGESDG